MCERFCLYFYRFVFQPALAKVPNEVANVDVIEQTAVFWHAPPPFEH